MRVFLLLAISIFAMPAAFLHSQTGTASVSIEPVIGVGAFWGAGAFSTNLNIQPASARGVRLSLSASPRLALTGEFMRSQPDEQPPRGCMNEYCATLEGPASVSLWSVGAEWLLRDAQTRYSLRPLVSAGLGEVQLQTNRHAAPHENSYRQRSLILGGAVEQPLLPNVALRASVINHTSLVGVDYWFGVSSHATARVGVRVSF
jgi:hypothetical protein